VSFQLGKYFADVKDVNVLDDRSEIPDDVKYIIYYGGEKMIWVDQKTLDRVRENYEAKLQYKDITVFERKRQ
jgi:hypothetical protein